MSALDELINQSGTDVGGDDMNVSDDDKSRYYVIHDTVHDKYVTINLSSGEVSRGVKPPKYGGEIVDSVECVYCINVRNFAVALVWLDNHYNFLVVNNKGVMVLDESVVESGYENASENKYAELDLIWDNLNYIEIGTYIPTERNIAGSIVVYDIRKDKWEVVAGSLNEWFLGENGPEYCWDPESNTVKSFRRNGHNRLDGEGKDPDKYK